MSNPRPRIISRQKRKKKEAKTEFDKRSRRREFTVFLVHDNEERRASLAEMLSSEKLVVREYMTAMEFYRDYREPLPGVLVLDTRLRGMSAIDLLDKLAGDDFLLPVLLMAGHAHSTIAVRAMHKGASEFLCKPVQGEELIAAVRRAYHCYYDIKLDDIDAELNATEDGLNRLTSRELEVLEGVMDGSSSRSIAAQLGISTKTVEAHRVHINDKMRVNDIGHLVRLCLNYKAVVDTDS